MILMCCVQFADFTSCVSLHGAALKMHDEASASAESNSCWLIVLAWSSYDKWCGKQCIGRFLSPVQCWNVTAHLSTVLKGNFDIQYLYFSSVFPFSARLQKLWENNLNTEQSLWGLQHWTTWWRCLLHDLPTRVESQRLQTTRFMRKCRLFESWAN